MTWLFIIIVVVMDGIPVALVVLDWLERRRRRDSTRRGTHDLRAASAPP